MGSEKPLHVRVAEALGWTDIHCDNGPRVSVFASNGWGKPPDEPGIASSPLPNYDISWFHTGPLIEKHAIDLVLAWPGDFGQDGFRWIATRGADQRGQGEGITAEGATPLLAVCHLMVSLHEAGKL